ncbi:hypothetical protein Mapa_017145 [Marchantia paleacea]|nr:hypothetical protein Mapa_017145 [Marchantia paleacea]
MLASAQAACACAIDHSVFPRSFTKPAKAPEHSAIFLRFLCARARLARAIAPNAQVGESRFPSLGNGPTEPIMALGYSDINIFFSLAAARKCRALTARASTFRLSLSTRAMCSIDEAFIPRREQPNAIVPVLTVFSRE